MNLKKISIFLLLLSFSFSASVQAEESKAQTPEDMQAMMEKAKKAGAPGAEHEIFNHFVGEWKTSSRFWMQPGEKAQSSEGSSSMKLILGGRFLKQKFTGNWMGEPFEGMGIMGYDNVKKEYSSIWIDNMMTGIFKASGQYDSASKTIKDSGSASCPMTGEANKEFRSEWKIVNKNTNVYSMYTKDASGKEFKSMEITYKRAK